MAVVNRCAVAVTPKPPMREWSRRVGGGPELAGLAEEQSLYLIPPYDDGEAGQALLRGLFAPIFAAELDLWCGNRELWPAPLTFELFEQWFSLELFPLVTDLGASPLSLWETGVDFRQQVRDALA